MNLSAIPEYAFIQPYSFIVCYGDDGKGRYDEGDSQKASTLIENIINSERFPFSDMIPADYSGDNVDMQNWFRTLEDVDPGNYGRLRVPKSLRKLIDNSGLRYGIVIYSYGYTQTKVGYQREKIEGITNPSQNYTVSDPYGNIMFCAVIDGQTDRVVHFVKEVPTFSSHPTEQGYVSELLHKLLKEFIR